MKLTTKKLLAILLALGMLFALMTGCSNTDTTQDAETDPTSATTEDASTSEENTATGDTFRVAIVQQMDHISLDEIRTAIEAELDTLAAANNITIEYDEFNGQNDNSILNQIGAQIVSDGYDAIIPIASLAAQCMATAAEGTGIPIIYAAISDPVTAGLDGVENITGTSDALNTQFIIDMMLAINPDIETVGLLYSLSEPNSAMPIEEAKAYLDEKNISYIESTGNTSDEIITAVTNLLDQVDAVFTPTDNVVMAAELTIAETLAEAGIPHYTGADSFVRNGAFATCGVNYTELGAYTAGMAVDILLGGDVPPYHVMEGGIITVNTETAAALNIDYSAFNDMASSVVEVQTTEE
jgi:putative ABC transport system substrate-binding protein